MASCFKALCLAGVASLAATAANAADLLPPPPAPYYAPPPAAPLVGGGWYLRGDVGVGINELQQKGSTFANNVSIPGLRYDQSFLDDSGIIGGGAGYQINQYLRADITGEYRSAAHYSATESYSCIGPCTTPRGFDSYNGSISSITGLINGYVDVGTWYGVTPFFGGGVGIAHVGFHNVTDQGSEAAAGGFGYASTRYTTNFAFALMAGLDFAVTQNLKMELSYRYLDQGLVSSGAIACQSPGVCPNEVQRYRLTSNDIRLGFRYTFADLAPPAFFPQGGPLIRKY